MSKSLDIQISTSEVIFRVQNVSHISSQVAEATKRLDAVAAPMVQADDDENNEAESSAIGELTVDVGIAIGKPLEYVVMSFTHKMEEQVVGV